MKLDTALQYVIVVLSLAAIYLVAQPGPAMKWGFVVGLISQPFWLTATWRQRQWGMFTVSLFYVPAWITGIANNFF